MCPGEEENVTDYGKRSSIQMWEFEDFYTSVPGLLRQCIGYSVDNSHKIQERNIRFEVTFGSLGLSVLVCTKLFLFFFVTGELVLQTEALTLTRGKSHRQS